MTIDTIRTGREPDRNPTPGRGVMDVTGVKVRDLKDVLQNAPTGDPDREVRLERHNGRTYVVTER